jgi:hypothetical protein
MPAIMNGHLSDREWELFCDQVDQHIVPLNKYNCLTMGGFFLIFVGSTIFLCTNIDFAFALALCLFFGHICVLFFASCVTSDAFHKVCQVCEATSRDNLRVTLHWRENPEDKGGYYPYIEASLSANNDAPMVTSSEMSRIDEAGYPNSTSYGATHMSSTKMSLRQRMENLQRIRHMLTTEEYEKKREEILAGV